MPEHAVLTDNKTNAKIALLNKKNRELFIMNDNETDAKIAHLNKKVRELYIMTGELSDEIRKLRDDNKMLWQSLSEYRKEFHKAETQKRLM